MPTPTYDLIASNVLSSSASSVTFSSIPATYRDLVLVSRTPASTPNVAIRYNGSTTDYSRVFAFGDGSTTGSGTSTGNNVVGNGDMVSILQIFDYAQTDKHKTSLLRYNIPSSEVGMQAQRWANTSAITTIDLVPTSGSLLSGSTFYLYGIA